MFRQQYQNWGARGPKIDCEQETFMSVPLTLQDERRLSSNNIDFSMVVKNAGANIRELASKRRETAILDGLRLSYALLNLKSIQVFCQNSQ